MTLKKGEKDIDTRIIFEKFKSMERNMQFRNNTEESEPLEWLVYDTSTNPCFQRIRMSYDVL